MKDNLEKSFRDSLKNYQEPYDPKAWEAVSAQLGGGNAAGGASSKALKWVIAGLAAVVVAVGVVYLWPNNDGQQNIASVQRQEKSGTKATPIQNNTDKTATPQTTVKQKNNLIKSDEKVAQTAKVDEQATTSAQHKTEGAELSPNQTKIAETSPSTTPVSHASSAGQTPSSSKSSTGTPVYRKMHYVVGVVSPNSVCEGETVTVRNTATKKDNIVRFQSNGRWQELQPGRSYTFKPAKSIKINFTDAQGNAIATQGIAVHTTPSVNFDVDANIYEKGLPVAICKTLDDAQSYEWSAKDQPKKKGESAVFNFFKQGKHKVTLRIVDANGCANSFTKVISIRKKYNLIAVDAFNPRSSDSRTNTFMPYALTVRNVKFHLTIIDPKDSHVVFTSKSADKAWDGVDQTTGKMTEKNKIYIWNVRIENPQPNERPIYVGTVVHS